MILPCISIRQPWAWAVAAGLKPFENRPRRWKYAGPILIHAGKDDDREYYDSASLVIQELSGRVPPSYADIARGGIVGAAVLLGCAEPIAEDMGWRVAGQFGLVIDRAITLPFRPFRGRLGLFKVELTPGEQTTLVRHFGDGLRVAS